MRVILAVDPGRMKCGIAVLNSESVLYRAVLAREGIDQVILDLALEYAVCALVLGNGTGSEEMAESLKAAGLSVPVESVDEAYSTLKARELFFAENPRRGLRRLIPVGLLTPDRPYDDYVAVILGKEYLSRQQE
jgi:RNase H-fold protein (predicted Holliday junction resolvase)